MTFNNIVQVISPLLSLFILINGIALYGTFVPLRLNDMGISSFEIGVITTAYYIGMTLGSFKNAELIIRVGHIRAFAAFASIICSVALISSIHYTVFFWSILRCILGYCLAGAYIVIESWILKAGTPKIRGQLLALYMISLNSAYSTGQLLLDVAPVSSTLPFIVIAILCSLSVVPLAITKIGNPTIETPSVLGIGELLKLSRSGFISCFVSGLIMSAALAYVPIYINETIPDTSYTATAMFIVMLGGMLLQYPVGKISDSMDRRIVIVTLCILLIFLCACILLTSIENHFLFYPLLFLIGGTLFSIYPVSMSLTCDMLSSDDIVAGTQGMILVYGFGAIFGPLITVLFIKVFGIGGLFIYTAIFCAALTVYLIYRIMTVPAHTLKQHQDFVTVPNTTPIAAELDPRSED